MIELIIKFILSQSLLKDDGRNFALNDSEICFSDEKVETVCEMRKSNVYSCHLLLREDYFGEHLRHFWTELTYFTSMITLKSH